MRLPALPCRSLARRRARVVSVVGTKALLLFVTLLVLLPSFLFTTQAAFAQTRTDNSYQQAALTQNTDPDVPQNEHTLAQTVTIEVFSAVICQLAGIDVIDPQKGCLGVNPLTKKIGYVSTAGQGQQIGGILGMSPQLFGVVYQQPASGAQYLAHAMDHFGIVKSAYAQQPGAGSGFAVLEPLQRLWEAVRNLTYLFFVVIFIVIGVGIMLRLKIDPRTVMTIQNQIPKIIVAILLITFSYAIVGFMIDVMWLTTYVGINVLTTGTGPGGANIDTVDCPAVAGGPSVAVPLKNSAYTNLLGFPLEYMNAIFRNQYLRIDKTVQDNAGETITFANQCDDGGVAGLSYGIGGAIGSIVKDGATAIFSTTGACTDWSGINLENCIKTGLGYLIGGIARVFGVLLGFIAIIYVMFRLWFELLRAYARVVVYTVTGPFYILFGLIPGSTLTFSGWFKTLVAKLAVFPVAAFFIIGARVVLELYTPQQGQLNPSTNFVPPLIGNPNINVIGPLLAFAILLITPELMNMINDALNTPPSKRAGPAIEKGFGVGAAVPSALIGGAVARQFRYNPSHHDIGAGAQFIATKVPLVNRWVQARRTSQHNFFNPKSSGGSGGTS